MTEKPSSSYAATKTHTIAVSFTHEALIGPWMSTPWRKIQATCVVTVVDSVTAVFLGFAEYLSILHRDMLDVKLCYQKGSADFELSEKEEEAGLQQDEDDHLKDKQPSVEAMGVSLQYLDGDFKPKAEELTGLKSANFYQLKSNFWEPKLPRLVSDSDGVFSEILRLINVSDSEGNFPHGLVTGQRIKIMWSARSGVEEYANVHKRLHASRDDAVTGGRPIDCSGLVKAKPLGFNGSHALKSLQDGEVGCSIVDTLVHAGSPHVAQSHFYVGWVWQYAVETLAGSLANARLLLGPEHGFAQELL